MDELEKYGNTSNRIRLDLDTELAPMRILSLFDRLAK
jgi:hypothetical protein